MSKKNARYYSRDYYQKSSFQFKVTIPYRARVVSGRLFVNETLVRFHLKDEAEDGDGDGGTLHPKMARNLTVKNEFSVPVSYTILSHYSLVGIWLPDVSVRVAECFLTNPYLT